MKERDWERGKDRIRNWEEEWDIERKREGENEKDFVLFNQNCAKHILQKIDR